jgi:hypothetical protein
MPSLIEQLHAMRLMGENWDGYGAAAPQAGVIELAEEFVSLLNALLQNRSPNQIAVHVSPTRVGGVLIEWEDAAMQHEVEIDPDGAFGFLHLDKITGQIETRKLAPCDNAVVQLGFLQELSQMLAA